MGIYGTSAYIVLQRKQEIGIRLALGGQRGDILKLILKQGGRLAVTGLAIGVAISFALAPLVRSLLFDTSARDPLTHLAVGALLLSAALVACVFCLLAVPCPWTHLLPCGTNSAAGAKLPSNHRRVVKR